MNQRVSFERSCDRTLTPYTAPITTLTLVFLLSAAALIVPRAAESSIIFSTISQHELSVGDRVQFTVSTVVPRGASVTPPDPATGFGPLVVKEWNSKKHELSKADSIVFDYVVTTYKAENCTIPALPYVVENGQAFDSLKTVPAPLTVIPMVTADTLDIQDLKPQQVAGKRPLLWLWLLLGALALAAGILFGRGLLIKLKKPLPPPPPKPPYDEAIDALNALEAKQYLMKGMVREFVFELSDILKRYMERSFGANAAEFTTEEMLAWLGISPLDKSQRVSMEWFFRAADPVKFAKYLPDHKSIDRFAVEARSFIEATKPKETIPDATPETRGNGPEAPAPGTQKPIGGAA